ncbi:MAG: hypothetical protein WC404_00240 [Candidatus Omnitrophota bacterium]|jgi:hypothetical protein
MATSKIKIANLALVKIGGKRISSFDEDSAFARAVKEVYDDARDDVLAEHMWTFAQKRAVLVQSAIIPVMTEDGMSIVYTPPTDLIKVNFVNIKGAVYRIEENGILSNTEGLKIIYTYRNDNPITYFSKFTSAFVCKLAYDLCFCITESKSKAESLLEEYEKIRLPRAIAADSQQGTPMAPQQDEWLLARQSGSQYGSTGETWHPSWE